MFKNSGLFKISDTNTSKKDKLKDFLISFGICFLATTIVFSFIFFVKIPSKILMEPKEVLGEKSEPSVSRLILMIFDILIIIPCLIISNKFDKSNKVYLSLFLSYLAGTFLWQCIGECSWHFGFFRIETAFSLFIVIPLIILLIYLYKKNVLPWFLLIFIFSFMSNWLGHLIEIGPAQLLINVLPIKTSYIIFGSIFGLGFALYCIYRFIYNAIDLKGRIITSLGIFISICTFAFAFID